MAFDPQRLLYWSFDDRQQEYTSRDAILYALGVGLPLEEGNGPSLKFLIENDLRVLPTYAVTLATLGMWVKEPALEIDWVKLLHVGQAARFENPLPASGRVTAKARIKSLYDRGPDKGAICVVERRIVDAETGRPYCNIDQTLMLRGNGGFGGKAPPQTEMPQAPARAADLRETIRISPRAALVYRLSGDINPLHTDYAVAKRAGFERPILHGLASYGLAGALIVLRLCNGDPARLKSLDCRFSGVVMPGDDVEFSLWQDGGNVLFEAHSSGRKVLDQGIAIIG